MIMIMIMIIVMIMRVMMIMIIRVMMIMMLGNPDVFSVQLKEKHNYHFGTGCFFTSTPP